MKKFVESRKIGRKTIKKGSTKNESENANKVKNELKVNVYEEKDAIKH